MKIALVGYGKMGKAIESIALERNHEISFRIDQDNSGDINQISPSNTDIAIEFTTPETAYNNCNTLIGNGVKVITGTTGWLNRKEELENFVKEQEGTFLVASNFSIGVNLFYKVNKYLAEMMSRFKNYKPEVTEIHHIHKLDKPSGTAIDIGKSIIDSYEQFSDWRLGPTSKEKIGIKSFREGEVPGTHIVDYESEIDKISFSHKAFSRDGFALGAVLVAEWIVDKTGVYSMDDFINF